MNYQDIATAKELFDSLSELCDTMEDAGLWEKTPDITIRLRAVLQSNLAEFMLYLSASDGHLSSQEVEVYQAITGFEGDSTDSLVRYIRDHNIYSEDFESKPPLIMRLMSECERNAVARGIAVKSSVLQSLAFLFKLVGNIIISLDGITPTEKRDFDIIMGTVNRFVSTYGL